MSTTPNKSDRLRQLQQEQRDWLRRAVARSGLTPTEIARAGSFTPSTLTRFLNDANHKGVLSPVTISLVSEVTGEPLQKAWGIEPGRRGFQEAEATPYEAEPNDPLADAVTAFIGGRDHLIPWELKTRALEPAGFAPGDVLIMDMNGTATPGDVVCVQAYDFENMRAETLFRIYEPPFLVGAGNDTWRKPLMESDRAVAIKAVMLMSFRRRTARGAAA